MSRLTRSRLVPPHLHDYELQPATTTATQASAESALANAVASTNGKITETTKTDNTHHSAGTVQRATLTKKGQFTKKTPKTKQTKAPPGTTSLPGGQATANSQPTKRKRSRSQASEGYASNTAQGNTPSTSQSGKRTKRAGARAVGWDSLPPGSSNMDCIGDDDDSGDETPLTRTDKLILSLSRQFSSKISSLENRLGNLEAANKRSEPPSIVPAHLTDPLLASDDDVSNCSEDEPMTVASQQASDALLGQQIQATGSDGRLAYHTYSNTTSISALTAMGSRMISASLAPSTTATYKGVWKKFSNFCTSLDRPHWAVLPVSPSQLPKLH